MSSCAPGNLDSKIQNLKYALVISTLVLANTLSAAESAKWQAEWQRSIEAAKKEGQLSLYGGQEITHPDIIAAFNKEFQRTMQLLTRVWALIEEQDQTYLAETDTDGALKSLQAASCTYRIALGPRAGQKVLSLQSLPSRARPSDSELRVNAHGFSLHAAVRWGAGKTHGVRH